MLSLPVGGEERAREQLSPQAVSVVNQTYISCDVTPTGQDLNTTGGPGGERGVTGAVWGKNCELGVSDGGAGTTFHPVPAGLLCLLLLGPV